jgi:RimJ/RimL family protein N-acetyltransferase
LTADQAVAVFTTDRCAMRSWRLDEADRFFDLYRRWEVARWLGAHPTVMQSRDEAEVRILRWAELNHTAATAGELAGRWAVQRLDDGSVLGTVILVPLPDGDGEVEVGWHLHPDAWGHGYATESARGAIRWGFEHGLDEVLAVVRPDNDRSTRVCRRLGMAGLGRTTRYYDSELELFRLGRADGDLLDMA